MSSFLSNCSNTPRRIGLNDNSFNLADRAITKYKPIPRDLLNRIVRSGLVALLVLCASTNHASLYEERTLYKNAISALQAGRLSQFDGILLQLDDYPLVPYLYYRRLIRDASRASVEQAIAYRNSFNEYTFGERYMNVWLAGQAAKGNWANYVTYYQPTSDIIAQCRYALGLIRTRQKTKAYSLLADLWNIGESQHKSCDPAFNVWIRDGGATPELAWQRMRKALDERSYSLSRYVTRFMTEDMKPSAQAMYDVRRNPRLARSVSRFRNDEWGNDAWMYGLIRLARSDAREAHSLWLKHQANRNISQDQRHVFLNDLYQWLGLDWQTGLTHIPDLSPTSLARVIHAAIAIGKWQEADQWLNELPEEELAKYEWRYWRARTNQLLEREGWQSDMQALAQERTYYGFLAAQTIDSEPQLNEQKYIADAELEARLAKNPHAQMVFEFHAVGESQNGRREWRKLESLLSDAERMTMIHWFNERGLDNEAIWAANRGEMLNFLEVRFPTPFLSYFKRGAFVADVPLSFLLALSRQESAFDHRAISRAGARGLMQMMLPTAQATARNNRLTRPSASSLLDPRRNVELGSYHIAELSADYQNNRALIAAAYNAGKGRVEQWLREFQGNDTVTFIEVIPFRETREYVKGVLAFSVVYGLRNDISTHLFEAHEFVLPNRNRN